MDTAVREDFIQSGKSEDNEAYTYQGNYVELDKVFMDNIILNLPMRLLCTKKCKGLGPVDDETYGEKAGGTQHESVDPRMEALKKFFNN
jgi:uncharacterized protein